MCLDLVNCATIYKKDFKTIMERLINIIISLNIKTDPNEFNPIKGNQGYL